MIGEPAGVPTAPPADPAAGAYEERTIPEQEKAQAKHWLECIERKIERDRDLFLEFEKRRKVLRGVEGTGIKNEKRTNVVYSTIAALMPQTYAKNPDISATPSEAVSGDRYAAVKNFARTAEVVLSKVFVKDAKLKRRAKACVRSAMTTGVGWAKLSYQKDVRQDPIILSRMNDVQDNLQRLKATIAAIEDPAKLGEHEALQESLANQLKALQGQVEQTIFEGLVIDHVLSEDVIILDETVRSFDGYAQSGALAHRIWFSKSRYEAVFGKCPEKAKTYQSPGDDRAAKDAKAEPFYCVFEIWCKDENTVYTLTQGAEGYTRAPFQPDKLGKHWYSLFPLGFNLIDGQFYPMSDVELLEKLGDEYNETRDALKDHREDSVPVRVARAGGNLSPDDLEKIQKRRAREIVVLEGAGGKPLTEDLFEFSAITINPNVYDVTPVRSDIEIVSGASDATQGSVLKAKTATEAEILREGLQSRTAERQDAIEDWIADMANYATQILLQEMTLPQVQRIAGEDAVWPEADRESILSMVEIEIRAGSTGRPNRISEREQWTKLMPVIQQAMLQVSELRNQGQTDMADAVVELVRETLRRFDERIDLDRFMPRGKSEDGQQDPRMLAAQLQQQNAQLQQQLQAAAAELEQLKTGAQSDERKALYTASAQVVGKALESTGMPDLRMVMQQLKQVAQQLAAAVQPAQPGPTLN